MLIWHDVLPFGELPNYITKPTALKCELITLLPHWTIQWFKATVASTVMRDESSSVQYVTGYVQELQYSGDHNTARMRGTKADVHVSNSPHPSHLKCLCFDKREAPMFKQKRKKISLFFLMHSIQKRCFPDWLGKALLAIAHKNPPTTGESSGFPETVTVPLSNHSRVKLKAITKIKIAGQLVWQRSIS